MECFDLLLLRCIWRQPLIPFLLFVFSFFFFHCTIGAPLPTIRRFYACVSFLGSEHPSWLSPGLLFSSRLTSVFFFFVCVLVCVFRHIVASLWYLKTSLSPPAFFLSGCRAKLGSLISQVFFRKLGRVEVPPEIFFILSLPDEDSY